MRILLAAFFIRNLDHEGGGKLLTSLARNLIRKGIKVTMLVPSLTAKPRGVEVINYLSSGESFFRAFLNYKRSIKKIAGNFDVVYMLEMSPALLFFSDYCYRFNKNLIVNIAAPLLSEKSLVKNFKKQIMVHYLIKNKFIASLQKFKCRKYIVSTDYQKKQLIKLGVKNGTIDVVCFGEEKKQFKKISKKKSKKYFNFGNNFTFGYMGHLSYVKGVEDLIKAFAMVSKHNIEVKLAIAWSEKGKNSREVFELIKRYHLEEKTFWFGHVDINKFLSAIDVIVLPYKCESVPHPPLVLIEAFAKGVPVITTDVGGLKEFVKNKITGLIVKPSSPEQLTTSMEILIKDKNLRKMISEEQKKYFENLFDVNILTDEIVRFGKKLK